MTLKMNMTNLYTFREQTIAGCNPTAADSLTSR